MSVIGTADERLEHLIELHYDGAICISRALKTHWVFRLADGRMWQCM